MTATSNGFPPSMAECGEIRYALSDEYKTRIAGQGDSVFSAIAERYGLRILTRKSGLILQAAGPQSDLRGAVSFLDHLKFNLHRNQALDEQWVLQQLNRSVENRASPATEQPQFSVIYRNRFGQSVQPRSEGQARLVQCVETHDLVFVNGPAGTGKTYLAVALAVAWLEQKRVDKICLVRPAVEAGENLGFLPGDPREKVAPYLRPIYDTLQELLPAEKLNHYHETHQIEIAPLAYMRGRTLKRAFIILDEAQNATVSQMKMFLTRLGLHSKAIVTGDSTQTDLSQKQQSGFAHAMKLLRHIDNIGLVNLKKHEILRHRLVQDILEAYESEKNHHS